MMTHTKHPPEAMYKHFEKILDIDNDGKKWKLFEAFVSVKDARREANALRKQGRPWGKKTGGDFNVRLLERHLYHLVYYRRK